jgi:hypothetical protein
MNKLRHLTEDLMVTCIHLGVIGIVAVMVKDELDHHRRNRKVLA